MIKLKAVLFILIVGFLHVCCVFYFIADRISRAACNMPPYAGCNTPASEAIGATLGFPLGWIGHLFGVDKYPHPLSFSILFLNSLAAATVLWFVVWRAGVRFIFRPSHCA